MHKIVEEANQQLPLYTEHLLKLRELMDAQEKATELFFSINPNADLSIFDELDRLNNISALLIISLSDLIVICKSLYQAEIQWEKLYFTKQGYLTMYETVVTYKKHREYLYKLTSSQYPELLKNYQEVDALLLNFIKKHDYQNHMDNVRNEVAGHISSFKTYFTILSSMDGDNAAMAFSDFIKLLNRIHELLRDISILANKMLVEKAGTSDQLAAEMRRKLDELKQQFSKIP